MENPEKTYSETTWVTARGDYNLIKRIFFTKPTAVRFSDLI